MCEVPSCTSPLTSQDGWKVEHTHTHQTFYRIIYWLVIWSAGVLERFSEDARNEGECVCVPTVTQEGCVGLWCVEKFPLSSLWLCLVSGDGNVVTGTCFQFPVASYSSFPLLFVLNNLSFFHLFSFCLKYL